MANDCIPFYEPGGAITCQTTAAVTGKRFVAISGNRTSGPGLATTAEGGNYRVATCAAAAKAFGVAKYDAASGAKVGVWCQPGIVVPVTAAANITAGQEVEVGATGQATPLAAGKAVGMALTAATTGNDAEIRLY